MSTRQFSPLEINQLQKHGFYADDLSPLGEKPVEYVTGHADFCDLDFLVTPATLIPRLESEKIVELGFEHLSRQKISHPVVADIGTGSGCLAVSLAAKLLKNNIPYTIYLSDISTEALAVAEKNASRLLSSTVNLFFEPSNLLENYPQIKFDLILANLPYIPTANLSALPPSVKDFEPLTALDGGPQGTSLLQRLIAKLPDFLSAQGLAILEFDDTHQLSDFKIPPALSANLEKDIFGVSRFLCLHYKG